MMNQCDWSGYVADASAFAAILAAVCWFYSALVSRGAFWRKPLVGDFTMTAQLSARWNCAAALFACLAALLQAYVIWALPVCSKIIDLRS